MVLAAGLAVLGLLCWYVGLMIPSRGAQDFFVAAYAFLILAGVRFVWVVVSRGRALDGLPIPDRRAQWLVGGLLAFVIWSTLSTVMSASGPWQPWAMVIGLIRGVYPRGVGRVDRAVAIRGPVPVLATPTSHRTSVLMSGWQDPASPRRLSRPQHSRLAGG